MSPLVSRATSDYETSVIDFVIVMFNSVDQCKAVKLYLEEQDAVDESCMENAAAINNRKVSWERRQVIQISIPPHVLPAQQPNVHKGVQIIMHGLRGARG